MPASWYCLTMAVHVSGSPAVTNDGGEVHAIHIGGCGFCRGFGTTTRGGIVKYVPSWPSYSCCVHIFGISCTASSHIGFESSGLMLKPPSSSIVIERPV